MQQDVFTDLYLFLSDIARYAAKSLLKMLKRWPSTISNCVYSLTENLRVSTSPEYVVLGSCAVLSTQTVLKRLTTVIIYRKSIVQDVGLKNFTKTLIFCLPKDGKALSSFLLGILSR